MTQGINDYGEYNESLETDIFNESNISSESIKINETENIEEADGKDKNAVQRNLKTKDKPNINSITKYSAITAAAGVVASVFFVATILSGGASNVAASIINTIIYGTSYEYNVSVSFNYTLQDDAVVDFAEIDTGLVLITVNSTENISTPLKINAENANDGKNTFSVESTDEENVYKLNYSFKGTVNGLQSGTRYKIQIIGDEDGETKIYDSAEIKTLGGAVTEFKSVNWKCKCGIDDTFRFALDYIDENGFYSDFSYSLRRDEDGSSPIYSADITEPKAEQVISGINSLPGKNYILTINYYSTAFSDTNDSSGINKVLKTVNIAVLL